MKKTATLKTILIAAAAVLLIFCFIKSLVLSGGGGLAKYGISVMTMLKGWKFQGEEVLKGNFFFIFHFLIPIAIGASWIVKKKSLALTSTILGCVNILAWIVYAVILNSQLNDLAELKIGIVFILDIVLSLAVAVVSLLVFTGKLDEEETDFKKVASTMKDQAASVSAMDFSFGMKTCPNCGAPMKANAKFCTSCGLKVEEVKKPETKPKKCAACGKDLDEDDMFCPYCGEKYKLPKERICADCGAKLKEGASFCSRCGAKYEEE